MPTYAIYYATFASAIIRQTNGSQLVDEAVCTSLLNDDAFDSIINGIRL